MDLVLRWVVAGERAELAALALWDHGATAVGEEEDDAGATALTASYPTAAAVRAVAAELGADVVALDPGWRDVWKVYAEPIQVGERLVVAPAWRPIPVGDERLMLEIDSGECFGSGSHASTRLILRLLAERPPLDLLVLDVGTGSGILAVAAARLGAAQVIAVDIDPAAVAVTEANAARNGVAGRIAVSTEPVGALDVQADLALVNVTAGVHAELGAQVVANVKLGGRLYLAGLLPGQWPHVAGAYPGCEIVDRPALDDWVGAVLERIS